MELASSSEARAGEWESEADHSEPELKPNNG